MKKNEVVIAKNLKIAINKSTKNWSHMKKKSHNNIYTIIKNKKN